MSANAEKRSVYYPCGLTNLGNTCFLNSCVQLLNYTHELANVLPSDGPLSDDRQVFSEWRELRDLMLEVRGKMTNPAATPGKFVKSIHDVAKIKGRDLFTGWAQNDLPEFLLFMIECMHNSMRRSVIMNIHGSTENVIDDLALDCYKMLKENYERGEYSEISDIFYGVYVSRLFTPDGSTLHSNKPEPFFILDLPIPQQSSSSSQMTYASPPLVPAKRVLRSETLRHSYETLLVSDHPGSRLHITLNDCFDEFVANELLSGWYNEKTQNKEPVRKNIAFWSLPKVLIVVLKRYSPDGRYKNGAFVDFPLDNLDLSKYVIGYKASSYKYRLFGVANHMGGIGGGHYTAFVKTERTFGETDNDEWYCFNDAEVSKVDVRSVASPSAYCLFYRKI